MGAADRLGAEIPGPRRWGLRRGRRHALLSGALTAGRHRLWGLGDADELRNIGERGFPLGRADRAV